MRSVRSVWSTTRAPRTASIAAMTRAPWWGPAVSTVMSRSMRPASSVTMSIEPITPPASPIAPATLPSIPGACSISTRMVSEYWALGTGGIERTTLVHPPRLRRGRRRRPPRVSADGVRLPRRGLPHRRQLARLPGLLRSAGEHLDLRRATDQRDLRLRLDAREDHHRPRRAPDAGRVGRRLVGAQGGLPRLQGPTDHATRPAQGAVAGVRAARRGLRLPQRPRRGLRGR